MSVWVFGRFMSAIQLVKKVGEFSQSWQAYQFFCLSFCHFATQHVVTLTSIDAIAVKQCSKQLHGDSQAH